MTSLGELFIADNALLVIDVHNIYALPDSPLYGPESEVSLRRINRLMERFAAARKQVICVRHVHRAHGRGAGRMFDFSGAAERAGFAEGSAAAGYVSGLKNLPGDLFLRALSWRRFCTARG